ncbi:MAG: HAD family hydrolase [Pseudomonadota bacterium]
MRPELVIFDCDGVLVDSEAIANGVLLEHLHAEGLDCTLDEAMAAFNGLAMDDVAKKAEGMLGRPLPADFLAKVQARTFAAFRGRLRPVAGARALVEAVQRAGIKTCIASSGGFDKMAVTLTETGLAPLFTGRVFSAAQVARGKPAPDLFLFAARRMGVAPSQALVIEDSLAGVAAARAAGMAVIALVSHGTAAPFEAAGARVVRHLDAAPALLHLL